MSKWKRIGTNNIVKLFHFTPPENYLLIAAGGLQPRCQEQNAYMTGGLSVVWLTSEESNRVTSEDVERMGPSDDQFYGGGSARLTVRLNQTDKHLMRYSDFLAANNPYLRDCFKSEVWKSWWIYTGTIPFRKIEPANAALVLECYSVHAVTHPNEKTREEYRANCEQLKKLPPDTVVTLNLR